MYYVSDLRDNDRQDRMVEKESRGEVYYNQ